MRPCSPFGFEIKESNESKRKKRKRKEEGYCGNDITQFEKKNTEGEKNILSVSAQLSGAQHKSTLISNKINCQQQGAWAGSAGGSLF